ncbi:MAG: hypothetical protein HC895_23190 [Leptolyngbyaceae cyanobacterium SM1_3_5]|nr:hypothetical protein [Leptolyngbyaceae cyanobacterium SM1_3_5]
MGSYGGGDAYQVSRTDQYSSEQVNAYLVVVPTQDGRSVLFLWNRNPQG